MILEVDYVDTIRICHYQKNNFVCFAQCVRVVCFFVGVHI